MFNLDENTFNKLKALSRIECTEEEKKKLLASLSHILAYIDQLKEVDTEGVLPTNHVLEHMSNVTREDEVGDLLPRELFLNNAPSHAGGMIRVPPVIKFNNQ